TSPLSPYTTLFRSGRARDRQRQGPQGPAAGADRRGVCQVSTRVAVVGDELVAGVGDPRGMGWVGRVVGRTRTPEEIEVYTLAVPGETSTQLSARWETECNRRF